MDTLEKTKHINLLRIIDEYRLDTEKLKLILDDPSKQYVSGLIKGKRSIGKTVIARICKYCRIPESEFFKKPDNTINTNAPKWFHEKLERILLDGDEVAVTMIKGVLMFFEDRVNIYKKVDSIDKSLLTLIDEVRELKAITSPDGKGAAGELD